MGGSVMTDRYGEPDDDVEPVEFTDEPVDEPTSRLTPTARQHLAQARAALLAARAGDRRSA